MNAAHPNPAQRAAVGAYSNSGYSTQTLQQRRCGTTARHGEYTPTLAIPTSSDKTVDDANSHSTITMLVTSFGLHVAIGSRYSAGPALGVVRVRLMHAITTTAPLPAMPATSSPAGKMQQLGSPDRPGRLGGSCPESHGARDDDGRRAGRTLGRPRHEGEKKKRG